MQKTWKGDNVAMFSHLSNANVEGQYCKIMFQRLLTQDQYVVMKVKGTYKCFQLIGRSSAN